MYTLTNKINFKILRIEHEFHYLIKLFPILVVLQYYMLTLFSAHRNQLCIIFDQRFRYGKLIAIQFIR